MLILCTETHLLIILDEASLPDRHITEKVTGEDINRGWREGKQSTHQGQDKGGKKMSVRDLKDKSGIQAMFRMIK